MAEGGDVGVSRCKQFASIRSWNVAERTGKERCPDSQIPSSEPLCFRVAPLAAAPCITLRGCSSPPFDTIWWRCFRRSCVHEGAVMVT